MKEKTTSQTGEETPKCPATSQESEQKKILQAAKEILKTYEKAFLELAK